MLFRLTIIIVLFCQLWSFWPTALLASTGQLVLTIVDKETKKPVACRIHLTGPRGKPFKPDKVPFWNDHFAMPGRIVLRLPIGEYGFVVERGLEYLDLTGRFTINHFADDAKQIELRRFINMSAEGWYSGDMNVRRSVRDAELLMLADDLHIAQFITWQNEKDLLGNKRPKESLVRFDGNRYYSISAGVLEQNGTELLIFNGPNIPKLPLTGPESQPLMKILSEVKKQTNLWVDATASFWWDLPVLIAYNQVDSIEIANRHILREGVVGNEAGGKPRDRTRFPDPWGNAQWSQEIYFKLLECGLRVPPSAGSGSGLSANPAGYNRLYVHVDGRFSYEKWWENFRAGRVFISNGPLLKPSINGELPGYVFQAAEGETVELEIGITLSTRSKISYLEIIRDGQVEHSVPFDEYAKTGKLPKLVFQRSGWFLVRAVTDMPKTYRFAMTGPYYVEIGNQRRVSKSAVQFFLDWLEERTRQIKLTDISKQQETLECYRKAADFWQDLLSKANAE